MPPGFLREAWKSSETVWKWTAELNDKRVAQGNMGNRACTDTQKNFCQSQSLIGVSQKLDYRRERPDLPSGSVQSPKGICPSSMQPGELLSSNLLGEVILPEPNQFGIEIFGKGIWPSPGSHAPLPHSALTFLHVAVAEEFALQWPKRH